MALARFLSNYLSEHVINEETGDMLFSPYSFEFIKSVFSRFDEHDQPICVNVIAGGFSFITSDYAPFLLEVESSPETITTMKQDANFTWLMDIVNDGSCPDWI